MTEPEPRLRISLPEIGYDPVTGAPNGGRERGRAPTSRRTMRTRAVPEGIRGRRGCNAYELARCLGQSDLGKAFDAVNAAGETADAGGPEVGA